MQQPSSNGVKLKGIAMLSVLEFAIRRPSDLCLQRLAATSADCVEERDIGGEGTVC
jgi:hypothetical protein